MKKKSFLVMLFFISAFLAFKCSVYAEIKVKNDLYMIQKLASTSTPKITSVTVNGDVATIKSSGSVYGYYIGTTNSVSANTTYYVSSTSNTYYVGVKNGTYYFWVMGPTGRSYAYGSAVNVTSSCTNQSLTNQTGTGTVERCMVSQNGGQPSFETSAPTVVTCASGYTLDSLAVARNECSSVASKYNGQTLKNRYCKVILSFSCKKNVTTTTPTIPSTPTTPTPAPSLTGLSVAGATISPAFASATTTYKTTVSGNTSSVKINAIAASGSSFVSGYGSRTVNLSYGQNKFLIKVNNSAGVTKTYTVYITREDNRSTVNTLSSLTVDNGELSPAFNANTLSYSVNVDNNIESLKIAANLTDSKSKFVDGFGPRTVTLSPGMNSVMLKVQSESGKLNVYTLNIMRAIEDPICTTQVDTLALLKQINLVSDLEDVEMPDIAFDPTQYIYTDIKVPYEIAHLSLEVATQTEGDTYTISETNNLEVNVERTVNIVVTSKQCPKVTKTYTLIVTRQEEYIPNSNAELATLIVTGHSDVEFESNKETYKVILGQNENQLDLKYNAVEKTTKCTDSGNEKLTTGKKITITCIAEDGVTKATYYIEISGRKKKTNGFFVILIVLLIIAVLVFIVLRLLGYKIYINFAVIGAFFRGIGEKIKNIFDK